jgi:peptidoglycan/LPS O-acetylase OafA/YrhL
LNFFHPLNFIRYILAVGVVLFHYGKNYEPFNSGWLHTLIVNSSFRVSFFFFISGFVMCLVYGPQVNSLRASDFYKKRLTRILPMFWLAFIASIVLIITVLHASPKGLILILHFLGLQTLYPGYVLDLNFTAWSISVELIFYSLFPFFLRWMTRLSVRQLLLATALLWVVQSAQHIYFVEKLYNGTKAMEEFISTFPLWHLVTFIGGMATARWIVSDRFPAIARKYSTTLFFLCVAAFAYVIFIPNPVSKYIHNGLLVPLFALTVLSLYYDRGFLHRVLSAPAVSRLGDLSYAIFIFQYPLWIVCAEVAGEKVTSNGFFICYFGVLLVFAWAINKYFEKPMLRYLRREKLTSKDTEQAQRTQR